MISIQAKKIEITKEGRDQSWALLKHWLYFCVRVLRGENLMKEREEYESMYVSTHNWGIGNTYKELLFNPSD